MTTNSTNLNAAPITLESITKTRDHFKQEFPLAGLKPVVSPFIPEGHAVMMTDTEIAIINTDTSKVTIVPLPTYRMVVRL